MDKSAPSQVLAFHNTLNTNCFKCSMPVFFVFLSFLKKRESSIKQKQFDMNEKSTYTLICIHCIVSWLSFDYYTIQNIIHLSFSRFHFFNWSVTRSAYYFSFHLPSVDTLFHFSYFLYVGTLHGK